MDFCQPLGHRSLPADRFRPSPLSVSPCHIFTLGGTYDRGLLPLFLLLANEYFPAHRAQQELLSGDLRVPRKIIAGALQQVAAPRIRTKSKRPANTHVIQCDHFSIAPFSHGTFSTACGIRYEPAACHYEHLTKKDTGRTAGSYTKSQIEWQFWSWTAFPRTCGIPEISIYGCPRRSTRRSQVRTLGHSFNANCVHLRHK
jgi:hypothetical protein